MSSLHPREVEVMRGKRRLKIHRRRWCIGLATLSLLLLIPAQASAHGGGGGTSWHTWASFLSLGVGVFSLGGGLYLDQKGDERRTLSDIGVLGGVCAIILSAALYWLM
jgi:hypothetical protein